MNNLNEARLKIAVFIDLDNISIGVKQSMNRNFDVGAVLEAIKEKGEIITKVAYGDWKRADDFSRAMTQHAIQMVQRNATPGGDKNGADIALALDALETAFTRPHINAFVIVGGDSDFIALVEKLKQYDKTVLVVGGRGFTSIILQKNCHEFISYENLVGVNTSRKLTGRIQLSSPATLENAMPLVRRALKILSDREVSPQLGLLKSTLLQLDSTFSERDYVIGSFRDFVQKLADAGYIYLKQVDRSIIVEMKEGFKEQENTEDAADSENESAETTPTDIKESVAPSAETAPAIPENGELAAPLPSLPSSSSTSSPVPALNDANTQTRQQPADVSAALEEFFRNSASKPHWPLYLRTFKQFLRAQQPQFDEKQYGISSTYDLARQAQRDGLFNIERNRQGILRIFPGERFPKPDQYTEESTASASPEISTDKSAYPAEHQEEIKELPDTAPVVPTETAFVETTPETAFEPVLFADEQTEAAENAGTTESASTEAVSASDKTKAKSRTHRKPTAVTAAKTSKPAQNAARTTHADVKNKQSAARTTHADMKNKQSAARTTHADVKNKQSASDKRQTAAKGKTKKKKEE